MSLIKPQRFEVRRDTNGNKIVTIRPSEYMGRKKRFKAFSIQTLGNLPQCHRLELKTVIESHIEIHLWKEILSYIKNYGSVKQKSLFNGPIK